MHVQAQDLSVRVLADRDHVGQIHTPRALARHWGVHVDKVLRFIHADGKKNATQGGKAGVPGTACWGPGDRSKRLTSRLSARAMLENMPLAGLSEITRVTVENLSRAGRGDPFLAGTRVEEAG